jgi:DNA-binding MarR family transcriptional regulator
MGNTIIEASALPKSDLEENPFRTLLRTFGLIERIMQPRFGRFGITGAQWGVLYNLHRAEQGEAVAGLRLSDLSQRLLIRPPSILGVVDQLQRLGLIGRANPTDSYEKRLNLTRKGRNLVSRIQEVLPDQIRGIMAGLTPNEQTHLQELLVKLLQGMKLPTQEDDA